MGTFDDILTLLILDVLQLTTTRGRTAAIYLFTLKSYLGNQLRVKVQCLPEDTLQAILGLQLDLRGIWHFLHKVKKRLHFPPGEGQHWVQVVHHPV